MWYYATILYFGKYYHKDPRERSGLAANAVAVSVHLHIYISIWVVAAAVATSKH